MTWHNHAAAGALLSARRTLTAEFAAHNSRLACQNARSGII